MTASAVNITSGNQFTGVTFNNGTSVMVVPGNHADQFAMNTIVIVTGTSTSNDGYYTCSSAVNSGGNTNVTVTSYSTGTANPGTVPFVTSGSGTLLNFGIPPTVNARYWRVVATPGNTDTVVSCSELRLTWNSTVQSLVGLTLTNLGSGFNGTYPMSHLNDGIVETSNGVNIALTSSGNLDVSVDIITPQNVTAINWAPQGNVGPAVNGSFYHQPLTMTLYRSTVSATGPWTQVQAWSGYSNGTDVVAGSGQQTTGVGASTWNPGTFRAFTVSGDTVSPP